VKAQLAAHGGHAEGVAVAADAGHHAVQERAGARVIGPAEGKRVQRRDGPRAHGEDVAQDAADAGRRALVGLDVGGVVVALHLEDDRLPVADVHHARVLAGAADHLAPFGRQRAQPRLRRLVGTVLVPHRREDAELGEGGLPVQETQDVGVFLGLEAVGLDELRRDLGVGHRAVLSPLRWSWSS
jgi:hypothetical protein